MPTRFNGSSYPVKPDDLIFLLCQAISQPPKYTDLVDLIDFDRYGVYTWSKVVDNKWLIPLKNGEEWQLEITKKNN